MASQKKALGATEEGRHQTTVQARINERRKGRRNHPSTISQKGDQPGERLRILVNSGKVHGCRRECSKNGRQELCVFNVHPGRRCIGGTHNMGQWLYRSGMYKRSNRKVRKRSEGREEKVRDSRDKQNRLRVLANTTATECESDVKLLSRH